jgi:hypothetical protein
MREDEIEEELKTFRAEVRVEKVLSCLSHIVLFTAACLLLTILFLYYKELERLKREDEHFARDHDIELRKAETRLFLVLFLYAHNYVQISK